MHHEHQQTHFCAATSPQQFAKQELHGHVHSKHVTRHMSKALHSLGAGALTGCTAFTGNESQAQGSPYPVPGHEDAHRLHSHVQFLRGSPAEA